MQSTFVVLLGIKLLCTMHTLNQNLAQTGLLFVHDFLPQALNQQPEGECWESDLAGPVPADS
jgi:hypothetical protein